MWCTSSGADGTATVLVVDAVSGMKASILTVYGMEALCGGGRGLCMCGGGEGEG